MLPDEVREAVERLREIAHRDEAKGVTVRADDLRTVLSHLLAREAEVDALTTNCRSFNEAGIEQARRADRAEQDVGFWRRLHDTVADDADAFKARAERAEALLRECLAVMELHPATHKRITAHLSENSRG